MGRGEPRSGDQQSVPPERESHPLEDEQPGVVTGVRDPHGHSHDPNLGQARGPFDRGVDAEHLRSASQGMRPEDEEDATEPGEADYTSRQP
jgi:hypothetical protein